MSHSVCIRDSVILNVLNLLCDIDFVILTDFINGPHVTIYKGFSQILPFSIFH